jgi:hypothetical protein
MAKFLALAALIVALIFSATHLIVAGPVGQPMEMGSPNSLLPWGLLIVALLVGLRLWCPPHRYPGSESRQREFNRACGILVGLSLCYLFFVPGRLSLNALGYISLVGSLLFALILSRDTGDAMAQRFGWGQDEDPSPPASRLST